MAALTIRCHSSWSLSEPSETPLAQSNATLHIPLDPIAPPIQLSCSLSVRRPQNHPSFKCHVAAGSLLTRDEGAASDLRAEGDAPSTAAPPSASVVASSCRPEHRLLVLHYGANCGQGAAMSLALSRCRAPLIAQMESDDERPDEQAFARMIAHLRAHPDWDGVSCIVELCGAPDREEDGSLRGVAEQSDRSYRDGS